MGKDMGFVLAGMPMDSGMLFGMFLIVAGIAVAPNGLLPREITPATARRVSVVAPEDAR